MFATVFTITATIFITSAIGLAIAQRIVRAKNAIIEAQKTRIASLTRAKKDSDASYEAQIKLHMDDKTRLLTQLQQNKLKWGDENELQKKIDDLTKKLQEANAAQVLLRKEKAELLENAAFWKDRAISALDHDPLYPPVGPNPFKNSKDYYYPEKTN